MSLKHGIPEPWNTALLEAGFETPWGAASLSSLAEDAGVHVATISRIIKGTNANGPNPKAISAIAKSLGKSRVEIGKWASAGWEDNKPYEPPEIAMTLTPIQREIVDSIIKQFAAGNNRKEGTAARPRN